MANNWSNGLPSGEYNTPGGLSNEIYGALYNYAYINDIRVYHTFITSPWEVPPQSICRKGVRNGYFVVDRELRPYGFTYQEGVGWENIFKVT